MQHRQHMHTIASHDMEDDVRKSPQEGAPGVAMDGRVAKRLLGDAFKGAINGCQKFQPKSWALGFVPSVGLGQIGFSLRLDE